MTALIELWERLRALYRYLAMRVELWLLLRAVDRGAVPAGAAEVDRPPLPRGRSTNTCQP